LSPFKVEYSIVDQDGCKAVVTVVHMTVVTEHGESALTAVTRAKVRVVGDMSVVCAIRSQR